MKNRFRFNPDTIIIPEFNSTPSKKIDDGGNSISVWYKASASSKCVVENIQAIQKYSVERASIVHTLSS
jgi:hypothetical protein